MTAPATQTARRVWATPTELVEWLQLEGDGIRKLKRMRAAGTGPQFVTVGREVRYAWVDVHAWCKAQREAGR